jgi:hypothetical protein
LLASVPVYKSNCNSAILYAGMPLFHLNLWGRKSVGDAEDAMLTSGVRVVNLFKKRQAFVIGKDIVVADSAKSDRCLSFK